MSFRKERVICLAILKIQSKVGYKADVYGTEYGRFGVRGKIPR
jgi:hypothetical protein